MPVLAYQAPRKLLTESIDRTIPIARSSVSVFLNTFKVPVPCSPSISGQGKLKLKCLTSVKRCPQVSDVCSRDRMPQRPETVCLHACKCQTSAGETEDAYHADNSAQQKKKLVGCLEPWKLVEVQTYALW